MSGTWLALDASTYAGSVAVVRDGRVVAEADVAMRGEREERLMPAVIDVLAAAGLAAAGPAAGRGADRPLGPGAEGLDAVVCGGGPGSFTSLRIAASIAKGLAFSLGAELWSVPSLALVVAGGVGGADATAPGRYLATLDAMRGDVYAQPFDVDATGAVAAAGGVALVPAARLAALAESSGATPVGPAAGGGWTPHARAVARLAGGTLLAPVDLARWEPDYGRLAEAQVRWEQAHGRPLGSGA